MVSKNGNKRNTVGVLLKIPQIVIIISEIKHQKMVYQVIKTYSAMGL